MRNLFLTMGMSLSLAAFGAACGDDDNGDDEGLEIVGSWTSEFADGTITEDTWTEVGEGFSGTTTIEEYDNDQNVVYVKTAEDAMFNPNTFSKIVYTDVVDDSFYYCTVVFDEATLADAKATAIVADPNDLEGMGCVGFPWTKFTKQ